MSQRSTLIYVTCPGHSGSTLLDLMLGAHSRVVSLGELKKLGSAGVESCSCGSAPVSCCPFWQQVGEQLARTTDLSLWDLEVESEDPSVFARHNLALLNSIQAVTGNHRFVDSSKSLPRLIRLRDTGLFDLRVVHLVRSPYGVVYSNVKRGRDWLYHSRNYTMGMVKRRKLNLDRPAVVVRYEELTSEPTRVLNGLMGELGLDFEPGQLQWASGSSHLFAGNAIRHSRDSRIRIDTSWRSGLTPSQRLGITWWTLPTRFTGTRLYDEHVPYWKGEGFKAWREFRRKRRAKKKREARARRRRPGRTADLGTVGEDPPGNRCP